MEEKLIPLSEVPAGQEVVVEEIVGGKRLSNRLTAMGLKQGMRVKVLHCQFRGPCVVLTGNTRLAIGRSASHRIMVRQKDE